MPSDETRRLPQVAAGYAAVDQQHVAWLRLIDQADVQLQPGIAATYASLAPFAAGLL